MTAIMMYCRAAYGSRRLGAIRSVSEEATNQGDPRFAGAMLRVVLALKRDADVDLGAVVERVIDESDIEPDAFRAFVDRHATLILSSVRRRGGKS